MTMRNNIAIGIGLIYCTVAFGSAAHVVANALQGETNLDLAYFALNSCEPIAVATSTKNVVLRIDDIQAYAWSDISQHMIDDAIARHSFPLVLAVIPKDLRSDAALYEKMRRERCNIEFAIHGWDHSEPTPGHGEFAYLSENEAIAKIQKGKKVIELLANKDTSTFVPPNNEFSQGAQQALVGEHMLRVSAYGSGLFDFDTESYDYLTDTFRSAEHILASCESVFAKGDTVCTIMLHPQDYATHGKLDPGKYSEYTALLSALSTSTYSVARFEDIAVASEIPTTGYVYTEPSSAAQ
jgi:predicted deacetylase